MACHSVKFGHQTSIITSASKSKSYKGVHIISLSTKKTGRSSIIYLMFKCFIRAMKEKADIYHIHEVPLMLVGISLIIFNKKVIADFHEDFEAEIYGKTYLNRFSKTLFYLLYQPFKIILLPLFHHIILAEDGYLKNFQKLKNKTTVIRNYPIVRKIKFLKKNKNKIMKILYLGTISEDRGCFNIIDAVIKIGSMKKIGIQLDLIGPIHDYSLELKIKNKILNSGCNINWRGQIPYNKVVKDITNYDVGFAALHDDPNFRYSLPTKLLEYNAAGLIAIVSNLPISHHYVEEELNGIIVKPDSTNEVAFAIERIWFKGLYEQRENTRQYIKERFSWANQNVQLHKLYHNIFEG